MRNVLTSFVFLLMGVIAFAQDVKITSFEINATSLDAKVNPRYDLNGNPCALLRISIPSDEVIFEGNIVGDPARNQVEWLVYMPVGSKYIRLSVPGFSPIMFVFPETLEQFRTYDVSVSVPNKDRVKALIMPTLSVAKSQTSYGLMVGAVKKFGGYVRAKTDFNFGLKTAGKMDQTGYLDDGYPVWLSGNSKKSRLAVTAGGLFNVVNHLYLYLGAGYGNRVLAWEDSSGNYYQVSEASYSGLEAEAGVIARFGVFAISAGCQTNSFKYLEANIGVGVLF